MLSRGKRSKHPLAVIGDSLSQGFQNGCIYRTDLSFPAMLARCINPSVVFKSPRFTAQAGIPLNLEVLLRGLEEEFGSEIDWNNVWKAGGYTLSTLKRIKKYWQGGMKDLSVPYSQPYHNQSVWGFAINDAWLVSAERCTKFIHTQQERFDFFDLLPNHAFYTTANLVLNPTLGHTNGTQTQLGNIEQLHKNGGIENLIVCLGHNNIKGAITGLRLDWSEKRDLQEPPYNRTCTIYRPEHFEQEYLTLARHLSKLGIPRVFVPTLPYVTIPPILRGVNPSSKHYLSPYFDFYTRFWIWDEDFDPEQHPHITREDAIVLDQTVDAYNYTIKRIAKQFGFHVVPVASHVSSVARRRLSNRTHPHYPEGLKAALKKRPETRYLINEQGALSLTTDFIRLDSATGTLCKGGIFSLDGIHPTTIGYGLMAEIYYNTMKHAGVRFNSGLDWDWIVEEDTLITRPPLLLKELRMVLRYLALGPTHGLNKIRNQLLANLVKKGDWKTIFTFSS
ncbi:MAG: hypothetical protein AAFW89_13520 [Bacteroidota bacterium]